VGRELIAILEFNADTALVGMYTATWLSNASCKSAKMTLQKLSLTF